MTIEKQEKQFRDPDNFIYKTILAPNKKRRFINPYSTKLSITLQAKSYLKDIETISTTCG